MKEMDVVQQTKAAILTLRDKNVLLDSDIAKIYNVETKRLNEQVKRNIGKFPEDFRFQLTKKEFDDLKSQNETSKQWGGTRKLPFAYTEHGVLQVANVINSDIANSISVFVIRAFIEMRQIIGLQKTIANKKNQIKGKTDGEKKLGNFLKQIGPKLQETVSQVMDTVIDPDKGSTVGKEGQDIIIESINNLKNRLKKTGLENEEIAAKITKLLAEAEKERAQTRKTTAEADQLEFMNKVRKLRLVLEAQKLLSQNAMESREIQKIDSFIQLLKEYKDL